jgi:hypothetical protein
MVSLIFSNWDSAGSVVWVMFDMHLSIDNIRICRTSVTYVCAVKCVRMHTVRMSYTLTWHPFSQQLHALRKSSERKCCMCLVCNYVVRTYVAMWLVWCLYTYMTAYYYAETAAALLEYVCTYACTCACVLRRHVRCKRHHHVHNESM